MENALLAPCQHAPEVARNGYFGAPTAASEPVVSETARPIAHRCLWILLEPDTVLAGASDCELPPHELTSFRSAHLVERESRFNPGSDARPTERQAGSTCDLTPSFGSLQKPHDSYRRSAQVLRRG